MTALVAVAVAVVAPGVAPGASAADGRTWTVAPWGDDSAAGSAGEPWRTLNHAVDVATSGDSIVLRGGVYRETVQVYAEALDITSAAGERAVLDGAVVVDGWQQAGDDWFVDGWTTQFWSESGDVVAPGRPEAGYPDQLFVDDDALRQVLDLADVVPGTFFHDTAADRMWIGDDPTGRVVEVSVLTWALYLNHADGSRLTDVTVRRYATEADDMAAIRVYSDDVVLDGVVAELNARIGLSAIGKAIVVTRGRFVGNGHLGVHGDGLSGFVLEESAVQANNRVGFDSFHSAGGVKLTSSQWVTIRDNDVSWNAGPGIWTDLDTTDVTIARNLVEGNRRAGVEVELSERVNVISNVAIGNGEAGVWVVESRDVQVLHNASFDNQNGVEVEEGPRRQVAGIRVENNTMGDAAPGSQALLDINDWTEQRSAVEMDVVYDHNAYWIPPSASSQVVSRIGRWPGPLAYTTDVDGHRDVGGHGGASVISRSPRNPFVGSEESFDYRWIESGGAGAPLSQGAAEALGVAMGERLSIGPVAPVVRR